MHHDDQLIWEAFKQTRGVIEEMGQTGEETPVVLLKQCLPFLNIARNSTDQELPGLEELITKIGALVKKGSSVSGQDIWKVSSQGMPPVNKMAATGEVARDF